MCFILSVSHALGRMGLLISYFTISLFRDFGISCCRWYVDGRFEHWHRGMRKSSAVSVVGDSSSFFTPFFFSYASCSHPSLAVTPHPYSASKEYTVRKSAPPLCCTTGLTFWEGELGGNPFLGFNFLLKGLPTCFSLLSFLPSHSQHQD